MADRVKSYSRSVLFSEPMEIRIDRSPTDLCDDVCGKMRSYAELLERSDRVQECLDQAGGRLGQKVTFIIQGATHG